MLSPAGAALNSEIKTRYDDNDGLM